MISVPPNRGSSPGVGAEDSFRKAGNIANAHGSPCNAFDVPQLKVGTLDALMLLSDELDKYDKHADAAVRRIVRAWTGDVADENEETADVLRRLTVPLGDSEVSPVQALQQFKWMRDRFPEKGHLPELAGTIHKQIGELDDEVKENLGKYTQLKNAIQAIKRKSGGNLLVRDLNGIVDQKAYVMHPNGDVSDKIVPVFIVVPQSKAEEFQECYETQTKEVVPRSWKVLAQEDAYTLGRVLHLDCATLQTYKSKMTEKKFTIREFSYDAQAVEDTQADEAKLNEQVQDAKAQAKQTLHMAFGEVFICHLHLKAVRIFVESVLWYGLPVNFKSMVIKVDQRREAALSNELDKAFKDAKGNGNQNTSGEKDDEDTPYVKFKVDLEFLFE